MLEIKIKYFTNDIPKLKKIDNGDWIDLYTACDIMLVKNKLAQIPLGVAMQLPEGFEAHLVPRSSAFKNYGILQTNSVGIIDNSYCGDNDEWKLPVYATREEIIPKGSRICQFRIFRNQPEIKIVEVEKFDNNDRGGFGSTGK